jgi:hypothetical protein
MKCAVGLNDTKMADQIDTRKKSFREKRRSFELLAVCGAVSTTTPKKMATTTLRNLPDFISRVLLVS